MTIGTLLLAFSIPVLGAGPESRAAAVLDDFHAAAADADGPRYFGHFAPDGVFLGTDATERWTVAEFKAYAQPHFSKGKGWAYVPRSRSVSVSKDGATAWFDELLDNAKYGTCRGSGVLLRLGGAWKIAQYNLSVPIPNELLPEFAAEIKARTAGRGIRDVSAREAAPIAEKRRRDANFVVLDVRTPEEFKEGRIPGAVNLDFKAGDFDERLGLLDRGKTYLLHCAAGGRSGKTAGRMKELGFRDVLHMENGFQAWTAAGLPTER